METTSSELEELRAKVTYYETWFGRVAQVCTEAARSFERRRPRRRTPFADLLSFTSCSQR